MKIDTQKTVLDFHKQTSIVLEYRYSYELLVSLFWNINAKIDNTNVTLTDSIHDFTD